MKIGIDARLFRESGVGRYIRNLIKHLQVLDKSNEYILFVKSEDFIAVKSQITNNKFQTVRADVPWHTFEEQLRMPSILNRENLDLVHFPYISTPIFYNRPFVVTIHDLVPYHFPTGMASTLPPPLYQVKQVGYRLVISQTVQRAKKIIAVSKTTKSEIIDHFGLSADKVVVTYEGVDEDVKAKGKRQKAKMQGKMKNYFLYVGNAYPHKNLERLLKALSLIMSQYPNISLVLVGKDDYFYKRLQEKVVQVGLKEQVDVRIGVSDTELKALYHKAVALVSPSLMEGFDLPVLEAMANKCPVVASDIPVHREICADVVVYFNPYDTNSLVATLKKVIDQSFLSVYQTKIAQAKKRVAMFSWEKMARETLQVYKEALLLV